MSGVSASNARTRNSNGVNDVGDGPRTYLGGADQVTAFTTVVSKSGRTLADLTTHAVGPGVCDQLRSFRKPTLLRAPDNLVRGLDSRSTQLPMSVL